MHWILTNIEIEGGRKHAMMRSPDHRIAGEGRVIAVIYVDKCLAESLKARP